MGLTTEDTETQRTQRIHREKPNENWIENLSFNSPFLLCEFTVLVVSVVNSKIWS